MIIVDDVRAHDRPTFPHIVLTIGSFDGVHVGHRAILDRVRDEADAHGGTAAVLTLRPHPREYFTPHCAPNLLTAYDKKLELLAEAGVDVTFVLPFDAQTAALDRHVFLEDIIAQRCQARSLIVGHDFRFGRNASGDYDYLATTAPGLGLTVDQVPPLLIDGERVSSTLIRERILAGELDEAARLLGRPHSVRGEVQTGRGLGREFGFPTANVQPHHSAVPPHGVYAASLCHEGRAWPAAVNIGIAPTVPHAEPVIEVHILDYDGDLRNQIVEVVFYKRLRGEKKFPTLDALIAQIRSDVDSVRQYFAS